MTDGGVSAEREKDTPGAPGFTRQQQQQQQALSVHDLTFIPSPRVVQSITAKWAKWLLQEDVDKSIDDQAEYFLFKFNSASGDEDVTRAKVRTLCPSTHRRYLLPSGAPILTRGLPPSSSSCCPFRRFLCRFLS